MKCENCMNLKHRYMLLTGMHYPEIQRAFTLRKVKALQLSCEGMGCQYYAQGTEISPDNRDVDWDCPYFKKKTLENRTSMERMSIDSHANRNEYPASIAAESELGD